MRSHNLAFRVSPEGHHDRGNTANAPQRAFQTGGKPGRIGADSESFAAQYRHLPPGDWMCSKREVPLRVLKQQARSRSAAG